VIVGVPIKCGLAANASIGDTSTKADITAALGINISVIRAVIFPRLMTENIT
jgi:hypothetical protein